MARGHLFEGLALWRPGGSVEGSSFHSNGGHLHLVLKKGEELETRFK